MTSRIFFTFSEVAGYAEPLLDGGVNGVICIPNGTYWQELPLQHLSPSPASINLCHILTICYLHAKMNPTSCLFGSRFAQNPVFLLAGALFFDEKIYQTVALFWFGLRDVRILYSRAVIQRTIDVSTAVFEHGSAEKIAHANRDPNKQEVGFIFA
jgi:hypothetical protein